MSHLLDNFQKTIYDFLPSTSGDGQKQRNSSIRSTPWPLSLPPASISQLSARVLLQKDPPPPPAECVGIRRSPDIASSRDAQPPLKPPPPPPPRLSRVLRPPEDAMLPTAPNSFSWIRSQPGAALFKTFSDKLGARRALPPSAVLCPQPPDFLVIERSLYGFWFLKIARG